MTDDQRDILRFRELFWAKWKDEITLQEMQKEVNAIMSRQMRLDL